MTENPSPMRRLDDVARGLAGHGWTIRLARPDRRSPALPSTHLVVSSRRSRPVDYLLAAEGGHDIHVWATSGSQLRPVGTVPDAESAHVLLRRDVAGLCGRLWALSA